MLMGIDLYERIAQDVTYGIITPNEARVRCGFEPILSEDTRLIDSSTTKTNCVNCGAVIDPTADHCEYCGTSYALMGISCAPERSEIELLRAKTKALSDSEQIKKLYGEAIKALRSYDRIESYERRY